MFLRSLRPCGSIPLAGSSRMITSGSGSRVLAIMSRCRMPRESSMVSVLAFAESPTCSSAAWHAPSRLADGTP